MATDNFETLRQANIARQLNWPGSERADLAFRTIEVAGEFGEVSETVKKLLRAERGIKGSQATVAEVAEEMADAVIALDLLAAHLGIELWPAIVSKFNMTSEKYGLPDRLESIQ